MLPELQRDVVVVLGDVNSTMAAALVAAKSRVRLTSAIALGLQSEIDAGLRVVDPLGCLDFVEAEASVKLVLTVATAHYGQCYPEVRNQGVSCRRMPRA